MRSKYLLAAFALVLVLGATYIVLRSPSVATTTIALPLPASSNVNDTITVPLRVSVGQSINAAEFYFAFPTDLLEVKKIVTDGSFFTLWVKDSPVFSNTDGSIYLAGGLPSPGFSGKDGLVATVTFATKKRGTGQIVLKEGSRLLLNDGLGTELPATYQPTNFSIR